MKMPLIDRRKQLITQDDSIPTFSLRRLAERADEVPALRRGSTLKEAIALFIKHKTINVLPITDDRDLLIGAVNNSDMLRSMYGCPSTHYVCLNGLSNMIKAISSFDVTLPDAQNMPHISNSINNELSLIVTRENKYIGVLPSREVVRFLFEANLIEAQSQNPLTGLPGNLQIGHQFRLRTAKGLPFRCIYIDINNFKGFNDARGFPAGDEVIKFVGAVIADVARHHRDVWLGHIGGDDFVVYCDDSALPGLCDDIVALFEHGKKQFYDADDLKNGFTIGQDREGVLKQFPLIGVTVAVSSPICGAVDFDEVGQNLASLKTLTKKAEGGKSAIRIDRRQYGSAA